MEAISYDSEPLNVYRKALPKLGCGIDLKVPEEPGILRALSRLPEVSAHYIALYNLLLDSGLRLTEAITVAEAFDSVERINGFYRVALGAFRGSKQAYYAYLTEPTYNQILAARSQLLEIKSDARFPRNHCLVQPKYLRKFAFDRILESFFIGENKIRFLYVKTT